MPGFSPSAPGWLSPGVLVAPMLGRMFPERNFVITAITRDANGAVLAGCVVKLFNTATDVMTQQTISDVNGLYTFVVDKTQRWYCVSYAAGPPDVAGTTINTLVGV